MELCPTIFINAALYKHLPSANDLKRYVKAINVHGQQEVCCGRAIHKLELNCINH